LNLLADEGVDRQIVERLRSEGHEVVYVAELAPGTSDDFVLEDANRRSAILVTPDKDFGELVFRQGRANGGVLLIRLQGLSPEAKAEITSNAIREHGAEMPGNFVVLSPGVLRIRRGLS